MLPRLLKSAEASTRRFAAGLLHGFRLVSAPVNLKPGETVLLQGSAAGSLLIMQLAVALALGFVTVPRKADLQDCTSENNCGAAEVVRPRCANAAWDDTRCAHSGYLPMETGADPILDDMSEVIATQTVIHHVHFRPQRWGRTQ